MVILMLMLLLSCLPLQMNDDALKVLKMRLINCVCVCHAPKKAKLKIQLMLAKLGHSSCSHVFQLNDYDGSLIGLLVSILIGFERHFYWCTMAISYTVNEANRTNDYWNGKETARWRRRSGESKNTKRRRATCSIENECGCVGDSFHRASCSVHASACCWHSHALPWLWCFTMPQNCQRLFGVLM